MALPLTYPTFVLPQHAECHINRVDVKDLSSLPETGKYAAIVYHRESKRFYAALTSKPQEYFKRMIGKINSMDESLPGIVREMIQRHDAFDFAYCLQKARNHVEYAMRDAGYIRVVTSQGSLVTSERTIFAVHDPLKKLTRYVSCDSDLSIETIIKKANKGFVDWVTRDAFDNLGIRFEMRRDFKEILESRRPIFAFGTSHVSAVPNSNKKLLKYHRQEVDRLNDLAVKSYLPRKNGTAE